MAIVDSVIHGYEAVVDAQCTAADRDFIGDRVHDRVGEYPCLSVPGRSAPSPLSDLADDPNNPDVCLWFDETTHHAYEGSARAG